MARRFLLVGVLVTVKQGSIEQIAYGTTITITFLTVQLICRPYNSLSDNLLAASCSMILAFLFVASLICKYSALVQLDDLQDIMSSEQKADYNISHVELSGIVMGCCFGAIGVLVLIVITIAAGERQRKWKEKRAEMARRLRYMKGGTEHEVAAPLLSQHTVYHLFLSHVRPPLLHQPLLSRTPHPEPWSSTYACLCSGSPRAWCP